MERSLTMQLESLPSLTNLEWVNYISRFLEKVSNIAKLANPSRKFASGAVAYPQTLATLSSMLFQVIGLPTGAHGAFRDYQIDAVTLQFPVAATVFDYSLTKFGRLLEGMLRSVNNLLVKWHQSFFLYFLSAPHKYVSVGIYMIPFVFLLISLPLTAVALCSLANKVETKEEKLTGLNKGSSVLKETLSETKSSDTGCAYGIQDGSSAGQDSWLQALVLVDSVQIWAFFVALILFLISQTNYSAESKLSVWLVIFAASLKVLLGVRDFFSASMNSFGSPLIHEQTQRWVAVKALTLGATSIGLAVMSIYNYPVALLGALILVPICLVAFPLQYSWNYANKSGNSIILACFTFAAGALK